MFNVFKRDLELEHITGKEEYIVPTVYEGQNQLFDLFIMNNSSLYATINTKANASVANVSIYDYFSQRPNANPDQKIETIETKDGYTITSNDIEDVRRSIGCWLAEKNYDSAMDVLASNNAEDKNTLLAYYESVWSENPGIL